MTDQNSIFINEERWIDFKNCSNHLTNHFISQLEFHMKMKLLMLLFILSVYASENSFKQILSGKFWQSQPIFTKTLVTISKSTLLIPSWKKVIKYDGI
jgi:hypothetical protein